MPSEFAGHAAAEQGGDADANGVLPDDGRRAGQHARPTGDADQFVLHPLPKPCRGELTPGHGSLFGLVFCCAWPWSPASSYSNTAFVCVGTSTVYSIGFCSPLATTVYILDFTKTATHSRTLSRFFFPCICGFALTVAPFLKYKYKYKGYKGKI